jgi:integrase
MLMAKTPVVITKTYVERAKAPKVGEEFHRDRAIRGFGLRVNWGGTKSFILEARVKGRVRRMTLGRYPDLSVERARAKALAWRSVIAEGGDPGVERERARNEPTFKELGSRYIEQHARPHKKSWSRDEARIAAHFGKWSSRRLSDITADDVVKTQQEIAGRHGKIASNRAMALLREMFNLAADWGMFKGANPAMRVKLFHEERRERFLSAEELRWVNQALIDEPNPFWRAYFPLLLMCGSRRNELLAAKWADIDLAARVWRLPATTTKAKRSHLVPFPAPAAAILESLPSRGVSEWLFPGDGSTGHLVEVKSAWSRIRERAKVEDVTVHDLRRTFGSWLAASGYSLPMIGAALNHRSPTSTSIYARLNLDPVRRMLEANAAAMFGVQE